MLLFVLIPSPVLKPACTLSEDHMLCFAYAVRTGILPLASLFTDWTTELKGWRCGLERVLNVLPAATMISAGSSIYLAALVPGSYACFLTSAALSVFLGILLIKLISARLRNICSIEEQLHLQKQYLATTVTKL
jgi:ABC-type siderophore export system fused ATPase/permease subunit